MNPSANISGAQACFKNGDAYVYKTQLKLIRPENQFYHAQLCLARFSSMLELEEYTQRRKLLHPQEQSYAAGLKYEKRRKSYLLGRSTAKQAVVDWLGETEPAALFIQAGVFTQPMVVGAKANVQVSITHSEDVGAALAFPEAHPMGIDLEEIAADRIEALERYLTPEERKQVLGWPYRYEAGLTVVWTAKEAISKVFRTGLMAALEIFEITRSEVHPHYILSFYKNFHQYKVISFKLENFICSIVYPLKTEMNFDIISLQSCFATWKDGGNGEAGAR